MIEASLDTSHGISLSIAEGGERIFAADAPFERRASEAILVPWIENCFHESGVAIGGVSRWTVGTGPGSFTGLRCGIAFVRGVCLQTAAICRGLPSSLAVGRQTAIAFPEATRIVVVNDARRGMVILSRYTRDVAAGHLLADGGPAVVAPKELVAEAREGTFFGSVHQTEINNLLPSEIERRLVFHPRVEAGYLLSPRGWDWPESEALDATLEPVYVRPPVFVKPKTGQGQLSALKNPSPST